MLSISVKVSGLDLFPGRPEVRAAIRQALRRSGQLIKVRAESNLSGRFVRMRTGRLRRGFKPITVRERGQEFVVTVKNTVFYGHVLEGGAAAHVIPGVLGKRALRNRLARGEGLRKTLRFEVGGKTIFARSIVHPGLRPRRWFASAVQEALPELERIFEQELGAVITKRSVVA